MGISKNFFKKQNAIQNEDDYVCVGVRITNSRCMKSTYTHIIVSQSNNNTCLRLWISQEA